MDTSNKDPSTFAALTRVHRKAVLDCCFSPDSDQILTGGEDATVVLWNVPFGVEELHDETINDAHKLSCYRAFHHKASVMSVAMHESLFISASMDGEVNLWKLISNQDFTLTNNQHSFKQVDNNPVTYLCHNSIVRSVTFSPDGRHFCTASDDKKVKIWSTSCRNKALVSFSDGHSNWINSVMWSKTNKHLLASCGDDGKICIWDSRVPVRQPPIVMITGRRTKLNCLDWHPIFEHNIVTGGQDSSCKVWDLRNRKQIQVYLEHNGSVKSVAFNPGGSLLLSGSHDKTCKLIDVCEGRTMYTLKSHSAPVTSVCFNSTGDMFASGSQDKTVTVWKRNFDTIQIVLDKNATGLDDTQADEYGTTIIHPRSDRLVHRRRM